MSVVLGLIGVGIMGIMAHRWYKIRLAKKLAEEERLRLEKGRKERRQRARTTNHEYTESELCVVCRENPKEVVLLPCGHVCICEDCSDDVTNLCPVCRAEIQSRNPAYIS